MVLLLLKLFLLPRVIIILKWIEISSTHENWKRLWIVQKNRNIFWIIPCIEKGNAII